MSQKIAEIVSSLQAAERGLDDIDNLPFGKVGKSLDAIMKHVQSALHAAESEDAGELAADKLLAAVKGFLFDLDAKADRDTMESAVSELRMAVGALELAGA